MQNTNMRYKLFQIILPVVIFMTYSAHADSLVCPVDSLLPQDPALNSAVLKIETRKIDAFYGAVVSIDFEKTFTDQSVKTQKVYGYGPWIRGVPINDIFLCNQSIETNKYYLDSKRIRLMSFCRTSPSSFDVNDLDATLDTKDKGVFKYSFSKSGVKNEVEIKVSACNVVVSS